MRDSASTREERLKKKVRELLPRHDHEDVLSAQKPPEEKAENGGGLQQFGPGLVTGMASSDPGAIGTYSVAGARFGYALLWPLMFSTPLMIAVQEMCARLGHITSRGLAAVLVENYSRPVTWACVGVLTVANVVNIWADLNVVAASARMLVGFSMTFWLLAVTGLCVLGQIFVPYRTYVKYLKWLCLALLSYGVCALMPSVPKDWGAIVHGLLVPHLDRDPDYLLTTVAIFGTTLSPYLFFWQASEMVEERIAEGQAVAPRKPIEPVRPSDIRRLRNDTTVGMLVSQLVTFFVVVATAGTLHATGQTRIESAQEAAASLKPLGTIGQWLFTLGILGSGLLTIPTLAGSAAYAVAEVTGWRYGLYRRFQRARPFYLTIALVTIVGFGLNFIGTVSPMQALIYSGVVNAALSPPLIVMLILACNNPRIVGKRTNGPASNVLGWVTVAAMLVCAGYSVYALLH